MVPVSGYVAEVFRSIQGEGPYVGACQIFVRTAGCSLSCNYCDTAAARDRDGSCVFRSPAGTRTRGNPVTAETVASFIHSIQPAAGLHSVSITGGEPLEQPDFCRALMRFLKNEELKVYLETNGLHEGAAREMAPMADFVALDIKLPSLCGGGFSLSHYAGILPIFAGCELICKVVVAPGYRADEFSEVVRIAADFDSRIPFVVQPATAAAGRDSVPGETLMHLHEEASLLLENVRVIPQCHGLLGLP